MVKMIYSLPFHVLPLEVFVVRVDGAALEGGGPLRRPPPVGVRVHGGGLAAVDAAAVVEAGGGRAGRRMRLRGGSQLTACRRSAANWSERHECQV